jgi:hypothetical protein
MENEENRTATAENVAAPSGTVEKKEYVPSTFIDRLIHTIAIACMSLVRYSDRKDTYKYVRSILATIFVMCSLDEYAVGPMVKQTLYRYDDYTVLPALSRLLVAKKVIVKDVPSSKTFLSSEKYAPKDTEALTPGEMLLAQKRVCTAMRSNPSFAPLSRSPIVLIGEAAGLVISNKNVVDKDQDSIYFLKVSCDDEARIPAEEWCNQISTKLFN